MTYQIFRNNLGKVDAIIRRPDGATVPIWDAANPLTVELREWELANELLDLADRYVAPIPIVEKQNYLGFYAGLLSGGINLFLYVRYISDLDLPVSNCYTDLMGAIQFGQIAGFQASISNLFASMSAAGYGLSDAQKAQMRTLLDANGFSSIVFPLG